jgi:hypothetical protein
MEDTVMPQKRREGVKPLYVELPEEMAERLQALAEANSRKIKAELMLAIEAHLAAQPAQGRPRKAAAEAPPAKKKGRGKK